MTERAAAAGRRACWREDYLFSLGASSWLIHLGVVVITALVLAADAGRVWVLAWAVPMLVATLAMAALSLVYRRRQPPATAARRFANAHSLLTAAIGLLWGGGALALAFFAPQGLLFYTLVLGGTALGATSSQHALPRSCLLSIWTALPLLAAAHLLAGRQLHEAHALALAAMIMLFAAMLSILCRRMHGFLAANRALLVNLDEKVAELEQERQRAESANAAKSRLLAQASHDLRQPVHAIGLFAACLREDAASPDKAARLEVVERIERSLEILDRLFRSLLDIAALDTGSIRAQMRPFAIGPLLRAVCRQLESAAQLAGCRLRVHASAAWVRADPAMVHDIMQNLIGNAIKYAPGGRIVVGCRREAGQLRLEVHDEGPGIAAEQQASVFDEFVRLQPAGSSPIEGLGLGLAIVRRLAGLNGLRVDVESPPGRGAVFRLRGLALSAPPAPLASLDPAPASGAAALEPAGRGNLLAGMRVVVIDDDAAVRDGMLALLARWQCAASGFAAPPAHLADVDFLLIDQMLGGDLTGVAFLEALVAGAGLPPAAIISGAIQPELAARAQAIGVPVLVKPLRPAALRSLLLTAASAGRR